MADISITNVTGDIPNDVIKTLHCDADSAASMTHIEATVDCNNVREQDCTTMPAYSAYDLGLDRENHVRQCVWEACSTVPVKHVSSNVSDRNLHRNANQKVGRAVKPLSHSAQKTDENGKKKRLKKKRKKSNHFLAEKARNDDRCPVVNEVTSQADDANVPSVDCTITCAADAKQKTDGSGKKKRLKNKRKKANHFLAEKARNYDLICPVVNEVTLQADDANVLSVHCTIACAVTECVDHVADQITQFSAGFEHNSSTHKARIGHRDDDAGANLIHTGLLSTFECQEHSAKLPVNSDENKNILNDDLLKKELQANVESLNLHTAVCDDLAMSNSGDTICTSIKLSPIEFLPGGVDEHVTAYQEQKKLMSKKVKRRKSLCVMAGKNTDLEQQNEPNVSTDRHGLLTIDEHVRCPETTTSTHVQDADTAEHEGDCAGFNQETDDSNMTRCISRTSADMLISSQFVLEDDLDDIAEFPVFSRRSSRRLRRTSIEIYRKSLHDADNAEQEECDAVSAAASDAAVYSADDDQFNELATMTTEAYHSIVLPTITAQTVDVPSDVQTDNLPCDVNGTDVQPDTDSSLMNITNSRPKRRRSTVNSQASLNVPVALPAKTRQRKPSASVEDIYLNRLWRSQMPKEKPLECILESPTIECQQKLTKRVRFLKFADIPNKTKLRQRRQKAVKHGWKPLTKKQNALLDSKLASKLNEIDSDLM